MVGAVPKWWWWLKALLQQWLSSDVTVEAVLVFCCPTSEEAGVLGLMTDAMAGDMNEAEVDACIEALVEALVERWPPRAVYHGSLSSMS